MTKIFRFNLVILVLLLVKQSIQNSSCHLGCQICSQNTCMQCFDKFILDFNSGLCIYQGCMQNFYFQPSLDYSQGKCQSICNPSYIRNDQQNICVKIEKCSFSYLSFHNIFDNLKPLDMIEYKDNYYAVFYDGYISIFQKLDLQLFQHIQFQGGDLKALHINNTAIVQKQDYTFEIWDLVSNSRNQIVESAEYKENKESKIYLYRYNPNPILILLTPVDSQLINGLIINQISGTILSQFHIQAQNKIMVFTFQFDLLIIQTENQIEINSVQLETNLQEEINIKFLVSIPVKLNTKFIDLIKIREQNNKYILAMADQLFSIDFTQQTFEQIKIIISQLVKIKLLDEKNQIILILEESSLNLFNFFQNTYQKNQIQSVKDFQIIQIDQSTINVLVLFSENILIIYSYDNQIQKLVQIQTQQIWQSQSLEKIIILNKILNQNNKLIIEQLEIALLGFSIQLMKIDFAKNQSSSNLILNYKKSTPASTTKVISIAILYQLMQLTTCHSNGDILFYDISSGQFSELFLIINNPQSICINTFSFLDEILVAQMSDKIIFISGLNWRIIKQIQISNVKNIFMQNNNDRLMIVQDQCIAILDDKLYSIFEKCEQSFLNSISFALFLFNYDLYLQNNKQVINIKFNAQQQQYEQTYLIFNIENQDILHLSYIKLSYNQQADKKNYFDIDKFLIFGSNNAIYLLNKQLQVQFIFQNVMFSKVLEIKAAEYSNDIYYSVGYNKKNPPTAVIYVLVVGKAEPIQLSIFPYSPYLGDTFLKVNQKGLAYNYYENIVQLGLLTVFTQRAINFDKMIVFSTRIQYITNDNLSASKIYQSGSSQNSIFYSGTASGVLASKSQAITNYDILNIENSFKNSTDQIIQLSQSIYLGKYFIRTKYQVTIYDLFTHQFLEILTINNQSYSFTSCEIIEDIYSIICFDKRQIVLRTFFLQDEKFVFTSKFNINGFVFDKYSKSIYIYGDQIVLFNSKLQLQSVIFAQNNDKKILSCKSTQIVLICISIENYLILIDKINFYQQQSIQVIGFQSNISLLVDEQYSKIILFNEICLIYSFHGDILQSLGGIIGKIVQYGIHDQYYIIFSQTTGLIINRNDMKIIKISSPASIQIVQYVYINSNQQIAYFCSASTFGQIYVYDILAGQTNKISASNGSLQIVKDMIYFLEQGFLLFVDQSGQMFLNFLFQPYQLLSNFYITEITDNNEKLLGLSYDYLSSYVFVYSQTSVYLINLSNFGYRFQVQYNQQSSFFTEINLPTEKNINQQFLLIDDHHSIVYRYSEQTITSELIFLNQQQIKDIRYDIKNDVLIIAFMNQILLYQKYEQNHRNSQESSPFNIDLQFQRFLTNNIYLTFDKKIIHIDLQSGQIINIIQINLNQFMNQYLFDEQSQILYFGFNDLFVLLYFVETKQFQKYQFQQINKMFSSVKFIGILNSQECFFATLGGQYMIINHQTRLITNQLNFNQLLSLEDDKYLLNFQYDNIHQRIIFNFIGDLKVYIWDLKLQIVEQIIGIPNTHSNQIKIFSLFIVTVSSSQLFFYTRTKPVQFQTSIQKIIIQNQIQQFEIIQDSYVILFLDNKIELYVIQGQDNYLIDQQSYVNPLLLKSYYIDQFIYFYGLHQTGAFKYAYNTNLYKYSNNQLGQSISAQNTANECSFEIQGNKNYQSVENNVKQINPITQQIVGNFGRAIDNKKDTQIFVSLSILGNQLLNLSQQLSKLKQINNILFLPSLGNLNNLVFENSTQIILEKQHFQIQNFNLMILQDKSINPIQITFDKIIQKSLFESISIKDQYIFQSSIIFESQNQVILSNFIIQNCTVYDKRYQNNESNNTYSYFIIQNVDIMVIYNMKIANNTFNDTNINSLFQIINVNQVFIEQLIIEDNLFLSASPLFIFKQISNIKINQLIITKNKQPQIIDKYVMDISEELNKIQEQNILIQIFGCNNVYLSNSSFDNNLGGVLLKVSNQIEQNKKIITLLDDIFTIDKLSVNDNDSSQKSPIIKILSSYVFINNLEYSFNIGNILNLGSQLFEINNSVFYDNEALDGGAIHFYNIQNFVIFKNSSFRQNRAEGSGGSLLFENFDQNCQIQFDNQTNIVSNLAKIGGGLRILHNQQNYVPPKGFPFKQNIFNNKAEIYGDDSTFYIQSIVIQKYENYYDSDQNKNYTLQTEQLQTELNNSKYSGIVQIQNFMSGGKIQLQVFFLDNYSRKINFSKASLRQTQYPTRIQKEIMGLFINIESLSSSDIQLIGDKQINYLLYDEESSGFILTDLTISASIDSQFYFTLSSSLESIYQNFYPILMRIEFRSCKQGEIIQFITNKINSCRFCSEGTYSFEIPQPIPDNKQKQFEINGRQQQITNQCSLCPSSALFCEGNQIQIKNGYWRPNQTTDEIIQCDKLFNFCQPEEKSSSIDGCIEGHVGALCRECDLQGKMWNKTGNMYAPSILKGACSKCINVIFSYFFLAFNIFCLLLYFFISGRTFFSYCQHTMTCYYLRKLNILPILRNSIQDSSGFYIKIIVTYLQFSSILIQQLNTFSLRLQLPISYLGSSNYYFTVGLSCILGKKIYQTYGKILVITLIHSITPIFYGFLILLILIFNRLSSYHLSRMFTYKLVTLFHILFQFFVIDQIQFFSSAINCVQIGGQSYQYLDYTVLCSKDETRLYLIFICSINLVIYSAIPLLIFYFFRQRQSTLNTCITRYMFGYYYNEFTIEYYYWDIIRIYLRIVVTLVYTLIGQNHRELSINIILLIFAFYIMLLIKYNPYIIKSISFKEITSYSLIMIKLVLNNIKLDKESLNSLVQINDVFFNLLFIIYFICIIFIEKSNNQHSKIGNIFRKIIKLILPAKYQSIILYKKTVSIKTYFRWRTIRKNMNQIVQKKAITNFQISKDKQDIIKSTSHKRSCSYSRKSFMFKQEFSSHLKKNILQSSTSSNYSPKLFYQITNQSPLIQRNSLKQLEAQSIFHLTPSKIQKNSKQQDNKKIYNRSQEQESYQNIFSFNSSQKLSNIINAQLEHQQITNNQQDYCLGQENFESP